MAKFHFRQPGDPPVKKDYKKTASYYRHRMYFFMIIFTIESLSLIYWLLTTK